MLIYKDLKLKKRRRERERERGVAIYIQGAAMHIRALMLRATHIVVSQVVL